MFDMPMDEYQSFADEYGLVRKNPQKGDDWMYFYRQWDSQLHDILNLTISESFRPDTDDFYLEFDWMKVYKAEWYRVVVNTFVNFEPEVFSEVVVNGIMEPRWEINTNKLPYNSIFNITITALNQNTSSE